MNFTQTISALRQRKIVQTGVVYAGASWGILQVLGFFVETYQWPRPVIDATLFVLACGLIAALTVAWFHGEKGQQQVQRSELGILFLLAAVALFGGWQLGRRDVAEDTGDRVPPDGTLAVLPFQNATGDESLAWLRNGVPDMLSIDLAQVPRLRVISGQRVFDLLKQEGVQQAAIVPEPAALRLARKASVGYLVRGTVFRSGATLRLQAELVSASDGVIAYADHVEGPDPLPLVDSLAARLAGKILKSTAPAATPTAGVAELATANLDAYREYQLALEAERNQRGMDAFPHLRRAVELDSTFPQALLHLGLGELQNNSLTAGLAHLDAARRHLDKASDRDRLLVEGVIAVNRRDTATARLRFDALTRRYPDEKDAWIWLDHVYAYQMGSDARRIAVLQQVLRLDPTFAPALNQLAYIYAARGDTRRADSILDLYVKAYPTEPNPYDTRGEIREKAHRYTEARSDYLTALRLHPNFLAAMDHLLRLAARAHRYDEAIADLAPFTRNADPAVAAKAYSTTAELLLWKGQDQAALGAYARAMALVATIPGGVGVRHALLHTVGELWLQQGKAALVVDSLGPAVRVGAPTLWPTYGAALAVLHRAPEVQAIRDSIARVLRVPEIAASSRGALEGFDAVVAYYQGDWSRALDRYAAYRAIRKFPADQYIGPSEIFTMLNAGRARAALPLIAGIDTIAGGAFYHQTALYTQGRVFEANGRNSEAIRAYEQLVASWGTALRHFPRMSDAPERLARLKRG